MGYYPISLQMAGRPCLVVGGGAVAERKVEGLLSVGASVTVVSPRLTERLAAWAEAGTVGHVARAYRPDDLAGYAIAFVATDDGAANARVFRDARARGVLVNAADDPAHCDFILPSVLRRGELTVAVATGGASPALSRAIREELESYFTDDYAALAHIVAEVRHDLRRGAPLPDAAAWRAALDTDLRRLVAEGKCDEARARLLARLEAGRWG
ncbi:MAG: bifunctional precorrin-2 dehydrogenase/sirohydrochlorin ferrochelatase [Candidatus Rokubacteria bacterium]|nr:bifunctional precorrin-2 dehydrogenase/sirohydrochlorin ferrochelatase [Candidatus Rokubacteria bacterium]